MGLWAAVKAGRLGLKVLLVDERHPASGASGGLLGALMAHTPDRWNPKKQFQFEALVALAAEVAQLEAETGANCGYRRCGRLIPLPKPHLRAIAERNGEDARLRWQAKDRRFGWTVLDAPPDPLWIAPDACAAGVIEDGLAGRISPRGLIGALLAAVDSMPSVERLQNVAVAQLKDEYAMLDNGMRVSFGHCIVAAGVGSFPLLAQLGVVPSRPLGIPVKGQAALLRAEIDTALPIIYFNGVYIVAHDDGMVAIGSTSEEEFEQPFTTDNLLENLLEKARALCPAIADAPVVERWAGLRPKAVGRDPMVGPHPDAPRVLALTGGFKVSFGLAHRLADAVLAPFSGKAIDLPESFQTERHLKVAEKT